MIETQDHDQPTQITNQHRQQTAARPVSNAKKVQLYDVAATAVVTLCCKLVLKARTLGTHELLRNRYHVPGVAQTEQI